jgi:hypothetical protein
MGYLVELLASLVLKDIGGEGALGEERKKGSERLMPEASGCRLQLDGRPFLEAIALFMAAESRC